MNQKHWEALNKRTTNQIMEDIYQIEKKLHKLEKERAELWKEYRNTL